MTTSTIVHRYRISSCEVHNIAFWTGFRTHTRLLQSRSEAAATVRLLLVSLAHVLDVAPAAADVIPRVVPPLLLLLPLWLLLIRLVLVLVLRYRCILIQRILLILLRMVLLLLGPGRCCSPRHRMPYNSIKQGSKCVSRVDVVAGNIFQALPDAAATTPALRRHPRPPDPPPAPPPPPSPPRSR